MTALRNPWVLFGAYGLCLLAIAVVQSVTVALGILAMGLISAVMALGVNIQWGYAGLVNVGAMGFAALGGVAAVWVAAPPVPKAWAAGGGSLALAAGLAIATVVLVVGLHHWLRPQHRLARLALAALFIAGLALAGRQLSQAVTAIEAVNPALEGYLGGMGAPILLSWLLGALVAGGVAWVIGKIALGLRGDYLAIATLGIAEILIAVLKNEDWATRGVKNVVGLARPVPNEVDLAARDWLISLANSFGIPAEDMAAIVVRLAFCALFLVVVGLLLWLTEKALRAPWGRTMRAVRDNETAARAMGKDVTRLHLLVFVLGSAVLGMGGAMLVTLDGQFTPGGYNPMRYTFLIWIMVIIGGSGNNWGSVLGGLVIWLFWVEAEPIGLAATRLLVSALPEGSPLIDHFIANAAQMRLTLMGLLLLLAVRFAPRGLIPERRGG